MDVLARLATEEPDLSGLPGELTELITACMARVPRQRPTSSSMLAQLGDFTEAQAGPDEEHAYLPETAMALIGQYRTREYQRGSAAALPVWSSRRGSRRRRHRRLLHRTSRLLQARPPAQARDQVTGSRPARLAAVAQVAHGLGRMGFRRSGPGRGGCRSRRLAHQFERPTPRGPPGRPPVPPPTRCRGPLNASDKLTGVHEPEPGLPQHRVRRRGRRLCPALIPHGHADRA